MTKLSGLSGLRGFLFYMKKKSFHISRKCPQSRQSRQWHFSGKGGKMVKMCQNDGVKSITVGNIDMRKDGECGVISTLELQAKTEHELRPNDSTNSGCAAVDNGLSEDYCSGVCDNCVFWYADLFLSTPTKSIKNGVGDVLGMDKELICEKED
jgi:hypothetical protein